jgi:hypothetical protein
MLLYLIFMYRRRWLRAEERLRQLAPPPVICIDLDPTRGHDYGMDPELNATLNTEAA